MAKSKGRIDVALAEQILSDHYDTFTKKEGPSGARFAAIWTPIPRA